MSEISANLIKELREKTGAGIVDCKKALVESKGDIEAAVDVLRKSGAAKADKKSGRITTEGRIAIYQNEKAAALVEVNCETDFVAKNEDFQKTADAIAKLAVEKECASVDALLEQKLGNTSVKETLQNMVLKIGENIGLRRVLLVPAGSGEKIGSYIHMGNKIGVLVKVLGNLQESAIRDVAMHIAAAAPLYLDRDLIPAEAIAREKAVYEEQMKDLKKPPQVMEKIMEGKIASFADQVCLVRQAFVKDPSGKQSVAEFLKLQDASAKVLQFARFQVGEGMAKKEENFAAEVAKAIG
ncbi:MAG: elongation factor Ts [Deltaproteobacteria bacterium]|nr:elongation factor Ts [Deltaproteobacteria bacterium]